MNPSIASQRIAALQQAERERFIATHPRSVAQAEAARAHYLFGVPLHWMRDWPTPATLAVHSAQGITLTCADGHRYADFCLGDTGAMFGHSPAPLAHAIAEQAAQGLTCMLPSTRSPAVGEALQRVFGLPLTEGGRPFDIAIHSSGTQTVIEFEPHDALGFTSHIGTLRGIMAELETRGDAMALCREAASQMQHLLGFDRVMVFKFHEDQSGEVVAEARDQVRGLEAVRLLVEERRRARGHQEHAVRVGGAAEELALLGRTDADRRAAGRLAVGQVGDPHQRAPAAGLGGDAQIGHREEPPLHVLLARNVEHRQHVAAALAEQRVEIERLDRADVGLPARGDQRGGEPVLGEEIAERPATGTCVTRSGAR